MDNDQIKEQIESAKRAFVASKTRSSPDSVNDDMPTNDGRNPEIKAQKDILARVSDLMHEASQTRRGNALSEGDTTEPPRPFWAQSHTDLSSFEKWERQQNMTKSNDAPEVATEVPPVSTMRETPPPIKGDTDRELSAIRDEVIGRIDNGEKSENAEKILKLTEKLNYLEGRIDKHQQDISALLQLIRQTSARQKQDIVDERFIAQQVTSKSSSITGLVFSVLFLIAVAIAGWLFWINPVLMTNLATMLVNETFTTMMKIVSLFGLV